MLQSLQGLRPNNTNGIVQFSKSGQINRSLNPYQQSLNDSLTIMFGAKRNIPQANTIEGSRYVNERLGIGSDVLQDLIATMDASMTVAGEVYSGNEAFTTLFHVKMTDKGNEAVYNSKAFDTKMTSQVEHTDGAKMVLSCDAEKAVSINRDDPTYATSKAIFFSIEPSEEGKMNPIPVETLDVKKGETKLNQQAADWATELDNFYYATTKRLAWKDDSVEAPDLQAVSEEPNRLVNQNVYVTTDMLNKKGTGHGGIATANAVKDMKTLALRLGENPTISDITATFKKPFTESDSLQFDTTLDYIDENDNAYFSTRIYRFDTKGFNAASPEERNRLIEGPIIMVHGRMKLGLGVTKSNAKAALDGDQSPDKTVRAEEAQQWKAIIDKTN